MTRRVAELLHPDDAIAEVRRWAEASPHPVVLLPRAEADAVRVLEWLQVSTRSPLGAIAYHTGGLILDGWLRVLGAGGQIRALDRWNEAHGDPIGPLVADDARGGVFAWARVTQTIAYFAPDTLEWEDTGLGYGDWLAAMCTERFEAFYEDDRTEVVPGPDQGLAAHPPWAFESEGPRSVRAVSMAELWPWHRKLGHQLAGGG